MGWFSKAPVEPEVAMQNIADLKASAVDAAKSDIKEAEEVIKKEGWRSFLTSKPKPQPKKSLVYDSRALVSTAYQQYGWKGAITAIVLVKMAMIYLLRMVWPIMVAGGIAAYVYKTYVQPKLAKRAKRQ